MVDPANPAPTNRRCAASTTAARRRSAPSRRRAESYLRVRLTFVLIEQSIHLITVLLYQLPGRHDATQRTECRRRRARAARARDERTRSGCAGGLLRTGLSQRHTGSPRAQLHRTRAGPPELGADLG